MYKKKECEYSINTDDRLTLPRNSNFQIMQKCRNQEIF